MQMVSLDISTHLENFRRFIINSTCYSYIPESYLRDPEVFPERDSEGAGSIYVEAADKVTLKKIRDITFINARDVLGVLYSSNSGNTKLRWRQIRNRIGKVTGEASANSLVNLITAGVITEKELKELTQGRQLETQQMETLDEQSTS